MLYEMVTGRAPFAGETPSHAVVSILEVNRLGWTMTRKGRQSWSRS